MSSDFATLEVWNNQIMEDKLSWYLQVAINNKPAKYLICKRIKCNISLNSPIEELWDEHEKLTQQFLSTWEDVKQGKLFLQDIPIEEISLLDLNIELVHRMLQSCNFCEWKCNVDRTVVDNNSDQKNGVCKLGSESRVSSYFHHRGEELIFRGIRGSGTIFFTSCCLRCVFCQNGDISKDRLNGEVTSPQLLGKIASLLRLEGVHNINYVGGDPLIHLHTIITSIKHLNFYDFSIFSKSDQLKLLRTKSDYFLSHHRNEEYADYKGEFNVPLLWNSSFFMSEQSMRILRTVIDIWLPDFKYGNNDCARRLARTPRYFETISRWHKQIFDWGENFVIRHLIMPNHVECCSQTIFNWIDENIPNSLINIMDQYHPDSFTNPTSSMYNQRYEDISRFPTKEEIHRVFNYAKPLKLHFRGATFDN